MAAGFHVRANEHLNVLETTLLACIGAAIAIGRWDLIDSSSDISPWTLVVALCLLIPAAIVNVIVLLRGTGQAAAQPPRRDGHLRAEII
jgi:F0F1-type ATP synthase assembly protein I